MNCASYMKFDHESSSNKNVSTAIMNGVDDFEDKRKQSVRSVITDIQIDKYKMIIYAMCTKYSLQSKSQSQSGAFLFRNRVLVQHTSKNQIARKGFSVSVFHSIPSYPIF